MDGSRGRRRIPMERIPGLQARRVCFAKRRKGLFRKCLELCELLPGYELAAVAFSPDVGNPFAFAAPSTAASPADLFRKFLTVFDPLQTLVPGEGSDGSFPAAVSTDGTGGRTVEDDGAAHQDQWVDRLSFSPSMDDELTKTLIEEESFPSAVSTDGRAGQTVEDDEAAHHYHWAGRLSSSLSLDDDLTQTLMGEEERAKLVAALGWADGLLELGDVAATIGSC